MDPEREAEWGKKYSEKMDGGLSVGIEIEAPD
jgi:hypothetical protein